MARTAGDAGALLAAMRREILSLEPNAVFIEATTMEAQVDATLLPARLAAQTGSLVGIVATVLAAIGLYGVIAYAVARRTREIGIRMALGAAPGGVIAMVMRQGLTVAADRRARRASPCRGRRPERSRPGSMASAPSIRSRGCRRSGCCWVRPRSPTTFPPAERRGSIRRWRCGSS